jgi:hypothetical protein
MSMCKNIIQIVHGTEGHVAVYGPICHPQNIIWTKAKLNAIGIIFKCHFRLWKFNDTVILPRKDNHILQYWFHAPFLKLIYLLFCFNSRRWKIWIIVESDIFEFLISLQKKKEYYTNSSWHWGPCGSLWTDLSPPKYYMDKSETETVILPRKDNHILQYWFHAPFLKLIYLLFCFNSRRWKIWKNA